MFENERRLLQDDLRFKTTFRQEKYLNYFVESFFKYLNKDYKGKFISITPQYFMIPHFEGLKGFYGDIVGTLDNGEIVSLEMYGSKFGKEEYNKSFAYACALYQEQIKKENDTEEDITRYGKMKKVISINLINNNYKGINTHLINSYRFINEYTYEVVEDNIVMYLVRLDKIGKSKYNEDEKFIKIIKMINAKSIEEMEEISKGDEVMRDMVKFLSEWTRKSNENGWERYLKDVRYESEVIGEKKGEIKGKREGIKEGKREGILLGQKSNSEKTAIKMKNKGYSLEEISEITNLSKKEILSLK